MINHPADSQPLLEVRDLSFAYAGKPALKGLSFGLQAGQFHALLGPNGAGKSTLFALISRLFKLQQGDILLDGLSLQRAPARVLGNIGMVFQQSTLDLDLSVLENLHYHAALQGMARRHRRQRIEQELQRVEMGDRLHTRIRQLNGGHRRRVEIARALLHQPQLLLLDEATVGLDSRSRTELNRHVRRLCTERRLGVLWATHLLEEIQPDDTVTLLHQGRLLANATSVEIIRGSGQDDLLQAFEALTRPPSLAATGKPS